MKRREWVGLFFLATFPWVTFARKTNFNDFQRGLTLGAGMYIRPSSTLNNYEPVKGLGGDGNAFNNLGGDKILPYRAGFFVSGPELYAEAFFRYVRTENEWQRTSPTLGLGKTTFKGMGGGLTLATTLSGAENARILGGIIGEWIQHTALIEYAPSNEKLYLSSTNILVGPALIAEMYLGDLWSLSLMSAYEYGISSTWNVDVSDELFGVVRSAGVARANDPFQTPIASEFGGLLFEATFRLSFH